MAVATGTLVVALLLPAVARSEPPTSSGAPPPGTRVYGEASIVAAALIGSTLDYSPGVPFGQRRTAIGYLIGIREAVGFENTDDDEGSIRFGGVVEAFSSVESNVGAGFEGSFAWRGSRWYRYRIRAAYVWTGGNVVRGGGDASFLTVGFGVENRNGRISIEALRAAAPSSNMYGLAINATPPRRTSAIALGVTTGLALLAVGLFIVNPPNSH